MTLVRSALFAAASAAVLGGLWLSPESPTLWRMALAVGVIVTTQLVAVRYRVGPTVFSMFWGEAALIIGLLVVPAGWVPLAFLTGTLAAQGLRWVAGRAANPQRIPQHAASLALAAGVGALITVAVADPYRAGLTPTVVAALALGGVGYLSVTTLVVSLVAGTRDRVSTLRLLARTLHRKLPMSIGNIAVGVTVLALAEADVRLLLGLPLAFWLLHRTYSHRLKVTEDRRLWTTLAQATRSLNQPDERSVVEAGVRGALEVFSVGRAEVELGGADRDRRAWVGDQTGMVRRLRPVPSRNGAQRAEPTTVPLLVSGDEIGQLRVYFPERTGPSDGDQAALQAYSDALAAAVKDTVTHHELHKLLARSAHDAQRDPLTGLLNRAALLHRGEIALQLVPDHEPVALLLVDVNHFREVNDTLGHAAGDEVLKVAAGRLCAFAQPRDLVARLGADEFALLVISEPGGSPESALRRAVASGRELIDRLAQPAHIRGVSLAIEASVGVVVAPAGTADMVELLRRADAAMRRAKEGDAVGWYDSARDASGTDRLALLAELRTALTRDDELVLLLQPVVDLTTGAPVEVEALVRWQHPRRGLLAPADFVRAVEHSDLLSTFTEYVIDQALAVAARWAQRGEPVPVAVNLSARSLLDPRLPGAVGALLRKHQLPGRRLVLEITETVVASELPGIEEALASLRALGVRLAVDDFGTGYASLTFLTRVRLDEVKIDRTFVTTMADSVEAAAIVRTTVELGRDLGLRVVAEGVETDSQRRMLTTLGCSAAQGFHFAEPMPADRIGETLRTLASLAQGQVIPLHPDR